MGKTLYWAILFLTIIFSLFAPAAVAVEPCPVVVFIVDTDVSYDFVNDQTIITAHEISHGSIVARIIREEAPDALVIFRSVEGSVEKLREDLYLAALQRILDYKRDNPKRRVLVNISLAFNAFTPLHRELIRELASSGVLVVAAAGNNSSPEPVYPACFSEVVAVASAERGGRASFSNYGPHVDICAPGSVEYAARLFFPGLVSTFRAEGTSFASPRVVALLAELLGRDPSLTPEDALKIILGTADPIDSDLYAQGYLGAGVINRERALSRVDPYFRIKTLASKYLLPAGMALLLLITGLIFGPASMLMILLLMLVAFPAVLIVGDKLVAVLEGFYRAGINLGLDLFDLIWMAGSITAVLFFTGWRKGPLALSFAGLTGILILLQKMGIQPTGGVDPSTSVRKELFIGLPFLINLSFLLWALFMVGSEWLLFKRLQKEGSLSGISRYLRNGSERVRKKARKMLQFLGEQNVDRLFELLRETKSVEVRRAALATLTSLREPPLEMLLSSATEGNIESEELRKALLRRGGEIVLFLVNIIENSSQIEVERLAGKILQGMASGLETDLVLEVIYRLYRLLRDEKALDRSRVLELMEVYGNACSGDSCFGEVIDFISALVFSDRDLWVRYRALKTLAAIHPEPEELIPFLNQFMEDEEELLRIEAEGLLEEIIGD